MSKSLVGIKTTWAMQEEAFKSNLPLMDNKINKKHTFDRRSMSTTFPFTTSEIGHPTGVPLGFNKQTGTPILFDNFHPSLSNYNMVIFAKSGAGKSVTMKTLISRSAVLMGIQNLALDAEGEYSIVAESLGGINVVISPSSKTVINLFDVETEKVKDGITGRERTVINIENKVEDVTQSLVTMARGSTRSKEVNELTKQIIAELVAEEYADLGINSDPNSLYEQSKKINTQDKLYRAKKKMPTIGSWYKRLERRAKENDIVDYKFHYSYLLKVMKQYIREYDGQMAYFDGQSTFELLEESPFINLDISGLEEKFARPLAQQILLSWIWEKYVKKNSVDRKKAVKKRVIVDEAWMLLPYPEAVDFLNTMARRARKRNVSLAIISQRFQDFYEKPEAQAVLTSSDTKLFLAQDKSEIEYVKEVFKLSEGEAEFFNKKGIIQKIAIVLLILTVFNFIYPNVARANALEDVGGVLLEPALSLVQGLSEGVVWLMHWIILGQTDISYKVDSGISVEFKPIVKMLLKADARITGSPLTSLGSLLVEDYLKQVYENIELPNYNLTPEEIFSNRIPMLDVNFISPNTYVKADGTEVKSSALTLRGTIQKYYVLLRNMVLAGLMIVLLYIGIRILISSTAKDKAKYKEHIMDWLVAMCILVFMHVFMAISLNIVESISDMLYKSFNSRKSTVTIETPVPTGLTGLVTSIVSDVGDDDTLQIEIQANLMEQAKLKMDYNIVDENEESNKNVFSEIGYTMIYVTMVIYTGMFLFIYIKRVIYMAFLTLIAPVVALTYPIDKIKDGKAQAFNAWIKEYLFNLLIQPFHLIIYTVLIGSAMDLASENMLYALVALGFMLPAEKLLRKFFGFESSSTMGAIMGGALGGAAVMNVVNMLKSKKSDKKGDNNKIRQSGNNGQPTIGTPQIGPGGNGPGGNGPGGNGPGGNGPGGNGPGGNGPGGNGPGRTMPLIGPPPPDADADIDWLKQHKPTLKGTAAKTLKLGGKGLAKGGRMYLKATGAAALGMIGASAGLASDKYSNVPKWGGVAGVTGWKATGKAIDKSKGAIKDLSNGITNKNTVRAQRNAVERQLIEKMARENEDERVRHRIRLESELGEKRTRRIMEEVDNLINNNNNNNP